MVDNFWVRPSTLHMTGIKMPHRADGMTTTTTTPSTLKHTPEEVTPEVVHKYDVSTAASSGIRVGVLHPWLTSGPLHTWRKNDVMRENQCPRAINKRCAANTMGVCFGIWGIYQPINQISTTRPTNHETTRLPYTGYKPWEQNQTKHMLDLNYREANNSRSFLPQ